MADTRPNLPLKLGHTLQTSGSQADLNPEDVQAAMKRHEHGDWGDMCQSDKDLNDQALTDGDRIMSSYQDRNGKKFWIITEYDRSVTTVLLPDEY